MVWSRGVKMGSWKIISWMGWVLPGGFLWISLELALTGQGVGWGKRGRRGYCRIFFFWVLGDY